MAGEDGPGGHTGEGLPIDIYIILGYVLTKKYIIMIHATVSLSSTEKSCSCKLHWGSQT